MGLSFRKSIQILPGVKINLSKSGVSLSAGVSGLHASINTKGQIRGTASISGTGIRYTKSKNIKDLIPGLSDNKETKAKKSAGASKEAEPSEKNSKSETAEKPSKSSTADVGSGAASAKQASASKNADGGAASAKQASASKNTGLAKEILALYAVADKNIDWVSVKNSQGDNLGYENFNYLKNRAAKVLDGDVDTYLEIVSDTNPFDEFIDCGSEFSCSTDNPMNLHIDFTVNSDKVFEQYKEKDLVEDYICAVAIKAARDIFALLPVWNISISAKDGESEVMSVTFRRDSFEELNFSRIDASDTIKKFGGCIRL